MRPVPLPNQASHLVLDENKTLMQPFVKAFDKGNLEISFPMDTGRRGHPANGDREEAKSGEAPLAAVVGIDSTSVDADCDNGRGTLYGTPPAQRRDDRATHRIAREAREEAMAWAEKVPGLCSFSPT